MCERKGQPSGVFPLKQSNTEVLSLNALLVIALIVGIRALCRIGARHRAKAEQKKKAEIERQNREAARLQKEMRRQQAETKDVAYRQAQLEIKQARLAMEQREQAERIRKHDERIAILEFCITQAEADIAAEEERIAALYALMDISAAKQDKSEPGSTEDVRAQKQIISYQAAIHAAEKRKAKAEFALQTAKRNMTA